MKIVITGPESVGKSTLIKDLTQHFSSVISYSEYARTYVEDLNRPYSYDDVEKIAKQQLKEYDVAKDYKGLVIFDTFLIVTKIWFEKVYEILPIWFNRELKKRKIDLFLLCEPDIPWVKDDVRENSNNRDLLFKLYKNEIEKYGFKYHVIRGLGEERTLNAIKIIENTINKTI